MTHSFRLSKVKIESILDIRKMYLYSRSEQSFGVKSSMDSKKLDKIVVEKSREGHGYLIKSILCSFVSVIAIWMRLLGSGETINVPILNMGLPLLPAAIVMLVVSIAFEVCVYLSFRQAVSIAADWPYASSNQKITLKVFFFEVVNKGPLLFSGPITAFLALQLPSLLHFIFCSGAALLLYNNDITNAIGFPFLILIKVAATSFILFLVTIIPSLLAFASIVMTMDKQRVQ